MQFGDRATRRNKRPTYALQRVKQQEIGGDQISDDEDDGCAALLALQSAVPSRPPPCSPKGGKAEDERGNTSSQNGSDCLLMDKRKQKRASSSGDTGPEHGPSSSGSAEDVIYAVMPTGDGQQGQQQRRLVQGLMNESQGDELSDMEVDIVSETEKGCQVWFPPLPGDMERRRFQRHGNRYVMNQPMIIPELRASKRKRGMESVPYDGSWDMGLLMDPLMSLQPMLQSGGPFPGVADGPGNSKLQSGGGWDDDDGDGEDGSSLKDQQLHHEGTGSKRRLIWSQELHERFLAAIRKLGVKNAVPKAILNLMGVEGMSRENVASHLQKYRMHLKMMGANSNLSPDEMMQMHVNGEIADDHRRWNESENKSRWPLSSQGGGVFSGSQLSLSSSPPPAAAASMRLWSSASTPLPGSPLSTNGGSSLALPSGIVRNLASNSHAMAAAGVPPPAALMLQGGVPSGVGAQQAATATATATLGSLLGLPPLGLGGSWAPHLHASANQIDPSTPAALAAALMANGILSGGADGALSLAGLNGGLSASSLLRLLPSSIGEAAMAGSLMLPPGLFSLPSATAALGEGGKIVDGNNPT